MLEKYETIPEEAHAFLLSMHGISGIKGYLKKFPVLISLDQQEQKDTACSATTMWSGIVGNNTPVSLFKSDSNQDKIGFVLDPSRLAIPQADLLAYRSGGQLMDEVLKTESTDYNDMAGDIPNQSKYPNKRGYMRRGMGNLMFVTNIARNEHLLGEKESIYHDQGSFNIVAKNIWRKFFKRENNSNNEALCFQEGAKNPICGLLMTCTIGPETAKHMVSILKKYPRLKLYLYDGNAKEHILRSMPNKHAQKYLSDKYLTPFNQVFAQAEPFAGYSSPEEDPQREIGVQEFPSGNFILQFATKHPHACRALIVGLSIAAVVLIAMATAGLALGVAFAGAAGAGLLSGTTTFFASRAISASMAFSTDSPESFIATP